MSPCPIPSMSQVISLRVPNPINFVCLYSTKYNLKSGKYCVKSERPARRKTTPFRRSLRSIRVVDCGFINVLLQLTKYL